MTTYTLGHHESVLRSHTWRTVGNSAAYLRPHLKPGQRILDVGCGPGTITHEFATIVGPDGYVHGIDTAPDVVDLARNSTRKPAVAGPVFEVGNAEALGFPDDHFDIVHAHQVLQHLANPVAALREMKRVVRPGGLIAVRDADYDAMTWYPQPAGMDQWLVTHQTVARLNGAEPNAGRRLLSWAQEAGLADITPSAGVWCFATPEDRQWWGGLQADRILHSDLARQAVDAIATRDDLEAMSRGWRNWAASDTAWFAVLHGEILARAPQTGDDPA
ncbi:MAG TPA: methyltransferase domain-containing protein [Propionibacteriaceae bacterium]